VRCLDDVNPVEIEMQCFGGQNWEKAMARLLDRGEPHDAKNYSGI